MYVAANAATPSPRMITSFNHRATTQVGTRVARFEAERLEKAGTAVSVAQGVALCFDEWANDGDHGVEIMYNGSPVWQELASCGNRQGCDPVSWFE